MTSATDELRRLLDEHGAEWKDGDAAYEIEWSTPDERHCSAMYLKPTFTVLVSGCTPEQAIAATLGSVTLTAEQVREAIERNFGKVAVIDDGGEKVEWREGWVCKVAFNSQAIADELNAVLGSQREKELEQLVRDMFDVAASGEFDVGEESKFLERMVKLGVVSEC